MSRSVRKCGDSQSLSKLKSKHWQARKQSFVPSVKGPSACNVSSAQRVLTGRFEEHSERLERWGSKHTGMFYWSAQDGRKPTNMGLNNIWARREETDLWSTEVESRRQTSWCDFTFPALRDDSRHRRLHVHHLYMLFLCWRKTCGRLIVLVTPFITSWFTVNRFIL